MATNTPWGKSQSSEKIAPGIRFYTTAGHGGFHVTQKIQEQIPKKWRLSGCFERWYEEDCGWAPLAATFPDAFSKIPKADVERMLPWWESWVNDRR